ncbi:hypothetical protein LEN26_008757 [Aphanomyces euteiches]|nr:hypothetical protein AeMF1_020134 [Aphanomyces euteiches]KAH9130197.1 hypothetical protein LEN26_008757 [Aphanomyces euteiches]KAH9185533.1 hypothetical protein AeNC1_012493 [Aphanomyces euteiches]
MFIPEPSQRELMAIDSINQTIQALDLDLVDEILQTGKVYFRDASLSDWKAFVATEDQQVRSTNMEWMDGKIFIVGLSTQTTKKFLEVSLAAYQTNILRLEPDLCLLPDPELGQPPYNVQLPPGVDWGDFHTVKIEVAWYRTWEESQPLGRPNLVHCSYKVHRVVHHDVNLPAIDPLPISSPNTVIHLDSRLVLQLPASSPLPPKFPPQLDIDLFAPLPKLHLVIYRQLPPRSSIA